MPTRLTLLQEIERYLAAMEWPATRFGKKAVNDPALVSKLRRGRRPRIDTAERIIDYMAKNPPPPKRGRKSDRNPSVAFA